MKKTILLFLFIIALPISLSAQLNKGNPLIVINGKITNDKISSVDPERIESVNVLKDQVAIDAYGELGKNGVVQIFTKDYLKSGTSKPEPLILLNGVVYTSGIDSIDVTRIKSVSVIKDGNAIRSYGEAGKNGVILITTKDITDL